MHAAEPGELWLHDASGWKLSSVCVSIWSDPLFNSSSTNAHMEHTHTHTYQHVHTHTREQLKETAHPHAPSSLLLGFSPPPCRASGLIQVSTLLLLWPLCSFSSLFCFLLLFSAVCTFENH